MKKRIFLILSILVPMTSFNVLAIPARGVVREVLQPDGSAVRIVMAGDEFCRIARTEDGSAVVKGRDGYWYYAFYDIQGAKRSSGVRVSSGAGGAAAAAARNIPYGMIRRAGAERRAEANRLRAERATRAPRTKAGTDTHKAVIILAEFQDLKMKYSQSNFENMLTQPGYSYGGATGSALDYFNSQFEGTARFEFTVAPLVTLSKGYAYYGQNDSAGNDMRAAEAVAEACRLADPYVDFSQFDEDGDGQVDNVFVFVAGDDEAEGAGEDHIWSHQWYLTSSGIRLSLDGKTINSYAISTEITYDFDYGTGAELFTTIGTFCHEYSHCLGLSDLYDADYEDSGGTSKALWETTSLMDHGNYNNNGNTPPNYNALELRTFGIGQEEALEIGQYTLAPLSSQKRYIVAETDKKYEYYLFECRAQEGWDKYIGGSGLLIYHYDYSSNEAGYSTDMGRDLTARERWWYNEVNCNPEHECFDLVEAVPLAKDTYSVFWPNGIHTAFNGSSSPAFTYWSGKQSETGLSDIRRDGTFIRFSVTGPLSIEKVEEFQDAAIVLWTMNLSSDSGSRISITPSSGGQTVEYSVKSYAAGAYSYTFEGLQPNTTYTVSVYHPEDKDNAVSTTFTTKKYYNSGYPFIYLNSADRNSDGSFKKGGRMPLRVFNAPGAARISWDYSSSVLSTDGSGYYTIVGSGTVRAVIDYTDGTRDIISKTITAQ